MGNNLQYRSDFLIVSTGTKRNPYCTRQAYYKRRNQPQSDSQSLPHSAGLCFRQHHRLLVGLVTGTSALMDRIGTPIVNALYPIPKIALLPLFILWLGIGELSKVTIIALGVFFPVAMNTYSGVKNVDTLLIKVAVSFNASWWLTMKSVVLPSALPVIFAGLRLAAGTSLLLLVAAEMIAAQEGIGALILHYGDLMITDRLMAGVIVLSLLGLIFNLGLQWLEHKIVPWKTQSK